MSRVKKSAAVAVVCCTLVGGFEGIRLAAYRDVVGVPTLCMGETKGVRMGMTATRAECDAKLVTRLANDFAPVMERCAPGIVSAPVDRYAAHLSLAYNIGTGGYCKSTVVRLFNAGNVRGSCDAFLAWNKAGGRVVPGLTRRRQEERALCLKGL